MITWSEFFKTRRRVQIFQRIAGVPFAFAFFTAESVVLSLPIFDPTRMIFGMDPLVVVGASTIFGSVASYFLGVTLSGIIWRKLRPALSQQLNEVICRPSVACINFVVEAERLLCSHHKIPGQCPPKPDPDKFFL